MRAKTVNFERGTDPKEAMGIGQSQVLDKKLKEFKELDRKEIGAPTKGYIDKLDIQWNGTSWVLNIYSSNTHLSNYFKRLMEYSGLDSYVEDLNSISDLFPPDIIYHYKIKDKFYDAVEKLRENGYYVVESLEFERGRDPKEILRIGLNSLIPEITSDDLELLPDVWDDDKAIPYEEWYEEFGENYEDDEESKEEYTKLYRIGLAINDKIQWGKFFDHPEIEELEEYLENPPKGYKYAYNAYTDADGWWVVWSKIKLPSAEGME